MTDLARGGLEQKVMTIREGLAGRVSDGLLVRVSAIDTDRDAAFALRTDSSGNCCRSSILLSAAC